MNFFYHVETVSCAFHCYQIKSVVNTGAQDINLVQCVGREKFGHIHSLGRFLSNSTTFLLEKPDHKLPSSKADNMLYVHQYAQFIQKLYV